MRIELHKVRLRHGILADEEVAILFQLIELPDWDARHHRDLAAQHALHSLLIRRVTRLRDFSDVTLQDTLWFEHHAMQ